MSISSSPLGGSPHPSASSDPATKTARLALSCLSRWRNLSKAGKEILEEMVGEKAASDEAVTKTAPAFSPRLQEQCDRLRATIESMGEQADAMAALEERMAAAGQLQTTSRGQQPTPGTEAEVLFPTSGLAASIGIVAKGLEKQLKASVCCILSVLPRLYLSFPSRH